MGVSLWMDLEMASSAHKPETFLGVIVDRIVPVASNGLSLRDGSVEEILDAIVRSSSGAAWIFLHPAKPVEAAQPDDLWNCVRYGSNATQPIRSLCCVSWDRLTP